LPPGTLSAAWSVTRAVLPVVSAQGFMSMRLATRRSRPPLSPETLIGIGSRRNPAPTWRAGTPKLRSKVASPGESATALAWRSRLPE
jgi:hypothetical protein